MKVVLREYWPGVVSGEMESLERLSQALRLIGLDPVKVPVSLDDEVEVEKHNPLFVLDLHFDAPRIQSAFSVGALWNPLDYYDIWGGAGPWGNQLQHDLFVAANQKVASDWLSLFQPTYKNGVLMLSHSVPSSAVIPSNETPLGEIFYAGIGWDRGSANGHRHQEIFEELDKIDKLALFGPEKLGDGSKPWDGFKSYRGQLPFDGTSVITTLNQVGFGLCLSSSSHMASEIASNRVFETIAAGALPIVEQGMSFPFNLDGAIELPVGKSPEDLARFMDQEITNLKYDAVAYQARVVALQERLLAKCTLDKQLAVIADRVQELKSISIQSKPVVVLNGYQVAATAESAWKGGLDSLDTNATKFSLNLKQHQYQLLESPDSWVVFSNDEEYVKELEKTLGADQFAGVDVVHTPGQFLSNERMRFIPNDGISPLTRTVDSFCIRASFLARWLEDSAGCASIGSLLVGIASDANTVSPALKHLWVKYPYFKLVTQGPIHASALSSKLDEISLVSIVRRGRNETAELAQLALAARTNTVTHSLGGSILEGLAMEVGRLGLKTFLSQSLGFLFRRLKRTR